MATFTITRKLDLPSEKVWATVSDFNRPPSPAIKIEVEEKGDPEANGIGAIRNIKIKGVPSVVERLEAVDAQVPSLIGCYLEHLLKNISALLMLLPKTAQH